MPNYVIRNVILSFVLLCLVIINLISGKFAFAEPYEEVFAREESIFATLEDQPTHFRLSITKSFFHIGGQKFLNQKVKVEMQGNCWGKGVHSASNKGSIVGWTTADEKLIPPYNHDISPGLRAYHRIDLSNLEYQWHYLGRLDPYGEFSFASERFFGEDASSNKKVKYLRRVEGDWETYFSKVRQKVC